MIPIDKICTDIHSLQNILIKIKELEAAPLDDGCELSTDRETIDQTLSFIRLRLKECAHDLQPHLDWCMKKIRYEKHIWDE